MNDITFDPDTLLDLKKYDENYRRAKQGDSPPTTFQPVPDGKYQVVVDSVELTKTRTTGNPMLKWRLRIAGPAMADRILFKNRVITDRTIEWVEREFRLCGVNMESLSEIPQKLPQLINLRLEVTKKAKPDGHEDINFVRNLSAVGRRPDSAVVPEIDELNDDLNDDLPF